MVKWLLCVRTLYYISEGGTYKSSSPSPFSFIKILVVVGWATMVRPGPIPQSSPSGRGEQVRLYVVADPS